MTIQDALQKLRQYGFQECTQEVRDQCDKEYLCLAVRIKHDTHVTRDVSVTSPTLHLFRKPDDDFKLSRKAVWDEKHRRQSRMPLKYHERTLSFLPNQDQGRKPSPRSQCCCHLEKPLIAYPKHFVSSQDVPCTITRGTRSPG